MATPMEYDTLREIYSSAMATLTRLEIKKIVNKSQFKEDEEKNLETINYSIVADQMKNAAKPWMRFEESS